MCIKIYATAHFRSVRHRPRRVSWRAQPARRARRARLAQQRCIETAPSLPRKVRPAHTAPVVARAMPGDEGIRAPACTSPVGPRAPGPLLPRLAGATATAAVCDWSQAAPSRPERGAAPGRPAGLACVGRRRRRLTAPRLRAALHNAARHGVLPARVLATAAFPSSLSRWPPACVATDSFALAARTCEVGRRLPNAPTATQIPDAAAQPRPGSPPISKLRSKPAERPRQSSQHLPIIPPIIPTLRESPPIIPTLF